jgi:hypothetical protein
MSKINLYFGNPCDKWSIETIDAFAINYGASVERASLLMLERLLENLSKRTNDQSYLDDLFGEFFGRVVYAPRMSVKSYTFDCRRFPMIHFSSSKVIHRMTGDYWPITENAIKHFGAEIESNFGLEFLDYKWAGKQKWLNSSQTVLF